MSINFSIFLTHFDPPISPFICCLRGRYRESFEKAGPIKSNKVLEYTIDLRGNDYTFKKGHRIMAQVQSTWFPLYDRNPQKFVSNIFLAKEADF